MASKLQVDINGGWLNIICDINNTTIIDSYKVTSIKEMKSVINKIKQKLSELEHLDYGIFYRSIGGIIIEWRACNLLYNLNIYNKSLNLEVNVKWYLKILYFILSFFYFRY